MKKSVLISIISLLTIVSCKKDEPDCPTVTLTAPAAEVATLRKFIHDSSITAVEDPRGFFYRIEAPGSGNKPHPCSDVVVNYVGTLTNGKTFDEANNAAFNLSGLIIGWQEGIPLIGEGGSIILYLPPTLGYGARAQGDIPANSILIFKIDLKGIED